VIRFLDKQQLSELQKLSGSGGHQKQLATLLIRHELTATVDLKSLPRFAKAMKIGLIHGAFLMFKATGLCNDGLWNPEK
jgi:hypothetical protein